MTDLPDRTLYLDRLRQALAHGRRNGKSFVAAIVAVDRLDAVLSRFGRETGDAVMGGVARRLQQCLRRTDTVARYDADLFALLLLDTNEVSRVLGGIVGACRVDVPARGGLSFKATVSVGAGLYPSQGLESTALLAHAVDAVGQARSEGGNRFVFRGADAPPSLARGRRTMPCAAVSDPGLRWLLNQASVRRRTVRPGEVIYRAGDRFEDVHVLNVGLCKLISVSAAGHEEVAALLFKGDWLGFDGLIRGSYSCTAVMADTGEVWTMRYETLLRAVSQSPELMTLVHTALARRNERDRETMLSQHVLSADGRVADFLYRWAEELSNSGLRTDQILLPVTRAEIGAHLGLRLESVSRAISRLAREQLISFRSNSRREIRIPQLAALREFVRQAGEKAS